jgi:hypothetical protein
MRKSHFFMCRMSQANFYSINFHHCQKCGGMKKRGEIDVRCQSSNIMNEIKYEYWSDFYVEICSNFADYLLRGKFEKLLKLIEKLSKLTIFKNFYTTLKTWNLRRGKNLFFVVCCCVLKNCRLLTETGRR